MSRLASRCSVFAGVVEWEPLRAGTSSTFTVNGGDGEAAASAVVIVEGVPAPVVHAGASPRGTPAAPALHRAYCRPHVDAH